MHRKPRPDRRFPKKAAIATVIIVAIPIGRVEEGGASEKIGVGLEGGVGCAALDRRLLLVDEAVCLLRLVGKAAC